jgi:acyl-CoA hydrolase
MVGRTSMEVGVRVESENIRTGEVKHSVSAYLTFVALDDEGKTTAVPPLITETEEDRRRNRDAIASRNKRLKELKGGG